MSMTNDDIEISRSMPEWTGRVPKPSAVLALQLLGVVLLIAGAVAFGIGAAQHIPPDCKKHACDAHKLMIARISSVVALLGIGIGPFALASGWARSIGMMLGIVALSFLTALFPIGTIPAAFIGFLAIKNRDHVRDYYSQAMRGKRS